LAQMGARTQRLLWASTGTKNPEYSDVKYIEPLIGDKTINTIPPETLNAYRDHGKPSSQLETGVREAYHILEGLRQAGLDLDTLTQELEDEGVTKFSKAFEQLMAALQEKHVASSQELVNP
jgi:transaldolase